jgi:uncharacterized protein YndB with AHSA1/START domain
MNYNNMEATEITVEALINAPLDKVWNTWNTPKDVLKWNAASELQKNGWHAILNNFKKYIEKQ